jgi:hypothetical protein
MLAAAVFGGSAARSHALPSGTEPTIPDSLTGRSGHLRVAIVPATDESATLRSVADSAMGSVFHFITLVPFAQKQNGRVGTFTVGRYPAERRLLSPLYVVPAGFIEVTPEMLSMAVSTHFTLEQFVSARDQRDVWPKALVLDLRLVDKLELVIMALEDSGFVAPQLKLLSTFRTPSTTMRNARTAQAPNSRHQYGDAADFIVDSDGDGRMDDLNRDGRVDLSDARYLVRVILAVEAEHPELVGGIGVYRGPFVHVDARGERARWGLQ